jgi:acyl-CoA thioester hydrolase
MTNANSSASKIPFTYSRHVAYYETDAMGVVHHSNYIRYFEDARVDWMRSSGLIDYHAPAGDFVFAVHELDCFFRRPLKFDDYFTVAVTSRLDGVRIRLSYAITCEGREIADGSTVLVPLDRNFRPARLPASARALF